MREWNLVYSYDYTTTSFAKKVYTPSPDSQGAEVGHWGPITVNVTSWTDNQIVVSGFTGDYYDYGPPYDWTLEPGDSVTIFVWNPQNDVGPATFSVTVGSE